MESVFSNYCPCTCLLTLMHVKAYTTLSLKSLLSDLSITKTCHFKSVLCVYLLIVYAWLSHINENVYFIVRIYRVAN